MLGRSARRIAIRWSKPPESRERKKTSPAIRARKDAPLVRVDRMFWATPAMLLRSKLLHRLSRLSASKPHCATQALACSTSRANSSAYSGRMWIIWLSAKTSAPMMVRRIRATTTSVTRLATRGFTRRWVSQACSGKTVMIRVITRKVGPTMPLIPTIPKATITSPAAAMIPYCALGGDAALAASLITGCSDKLPPRWVKGKASGASPAPPRPLPGWTGWSLRKSAGDHDG